MAGEARTRVAMIGCGVFAQVQMAAWLSLPEAEMVAVCDLDAERVAAASALTGAPGFTDAAAMLDAIAPDVADIAAAAPAHMPLVRLCAERGIAAIVQKPLAMTLGEAVAIAEVGRRAGIRMMVHENFRFQRPVRAVKRLIAEGEIGEPRYGRVTFRRCYQVFPREPALRFGPRLLLMDMGVHVFDTARCLMGDIASLSCLTQSIDPRTPGEDMASALVSFESGAMGLVECSAETRLPREPGFHAHLDIEGPGGAAVIGQDARLRVRCGDAVREIDVAPPASASTHERWGGVIQDSVIETCRNWLDAERGRAPLEAEVGDNLKTLAAVEACYRSAAAGGAPVSPGELLAEAWRQQD